MKRIAEQFKKLPLLLMLFIQMAPAWAKLDTNGDLGGGSSGGGSSGVPGDVTSTPDEIIKYDIFSQWFGITAENMTSLNFFAMLTKYAYWTIFGIGVLACFWKILQAGFIIVQKNSAGAPDWMTIDLKMELWDPIKGLVILDLGLLVIGIVIKMAYSMGMFTGIVGEFIGLVF